jgi:CBS domain containing-hemolysin-like protein
MAMGKLLGVEDRSDAIDAHELMVYVDHGAAIGELDPMERDIIEAVFEFDDLTVQRLMTPRPDVFSVPLTIGWKELLEQCRREGLSRIPVTGHAQDDIIGVLLLKDLLKFRGAAPSGPRQLRSLLLPPVFVPASKSADGMLREFLEKRFHMAFVVDEHGTFVGLVTLDDLLGELVGTDDDATEDAEIAVEPDAMTVKASIDLEDFEEETGIRLPEGDYHTLGGFVFHQLGRLPRKGESVSFGEHRFLVSRMEGRRVSEIVVTPRLDAPPVPEDRGQEAM